MSKQEYCNTHEAVAYYSGFGGLEIHGVEYENGEDYVYAVSGAWCSKKAYHKLKVYSTVSGKDYIKLHGYRIPLEECIRIDY